MLRRRFSVSNQVLKPDSSVARPDAAANHRNRCDDMAAEFLSAMRGNEQVSVGRDVIWRLPVQRVKKHFRRRAIPK